MKPLCTILLLLIFNVAFAQSHIKVIGESGINDGPTALIPYQETFFIGGYSEDLASLKQVNPLGDVLWSTSIDFTEYKDVISALIIDGNYLIGCGYGNQQGSARFEEFFFKMNLSDKKMEWVKRSNLKLKPSSIHLKENGDYLILGDEYSNSKFGVFLLSLKAKTGEEIGFNTWYYSGKESSSSSFVVGNTVYTGGRYGLKPKVDKFRGCLTSFQIDDLSQNWSKYYLNSKTKYVKNYLPAIALDKNEIVAAFFTNNYGINSAFTASLSKMDMEGKLLWAEEYVPVDYTNLTVRDVEVTSDGYIIYGYTKSPTKELFLIKTNKQGKLQWAKTYGGKQAEELAVDQGNLIEVVGDYIYLVAQSRSVSSQGDANAIFLRLNADGSTEEDCWLKDMAIVNKRYAQLVEGEIGLTEYDTIFKTYKVNIEIANIKSETTGYICSPGLAKDDYDTLGVDQSTSIYFLLNDILPFGEQYNIAITQTPHLGEAALSSDTSITYTASSEFTSCNLDSLQYALTTASESDTATIYLHRYTQSESNPYQELEMSLEKDIVLTSSNSGESYNWSNGSTEKSITVSHPGLYRVIAKSSNCLFAEEFKVVEHPFSFQTVATNNITFLLDVSLSMNRKDRLPVLKEAMFKVLSYMRTEDKISVVTYSDDAKLVLDGVSANQVSVIRNKIDSLVSDGQSDAAGGYIMGNNSVKNHYTDGGNNRIIFTTDGDISNEKRKELAAVIKRNKLEYSYISIFLLNNSSVYQEQMQELANEVGAQLYVVTKENVEALLLQEFKAIRK